MSAVDAILRHAGEDPNATAVVTSAGACTYGSLERRSCRIAAALGAVGVEPGAAVAVMLPSGLASVEASLALLRGGFVHVAINIMFRAGELRQVLADSGARAILVDAERAPLIAALREELPQLAHVVVVGESGEGDFGLEEILPERAEWGPGPAPDSPAALIYTGGTTGAPKGAVHDHENIARQLEMTVDYYRLGPADSALGALPTFLMPPLLAVHLNTLAAGATLHLMERFDAAEALRILTEEKITFMAGSKTMCWLFNQLPPQPREDLSGMRALSFGGMYQPPEVRHEFERRFGQPTLHVYGMSEGPNLVAGTPRELPEERRLASFESVGLPLPGIEIAALDEEGRRCPAGESGEICVRADGSGRWKPMLGYHNRPEATAAALADGWYRSGDAGYLDGDGFVYVLGRSAELIKVSSWSVFPGEIEALILEDDRVEEAAVVGVPDAKSGQKPYAYLVLAEGAQLNPEEVERRVAESLAPFKRLAGAEVLDELPKNVYGKVQKRLLPDAKEGTE